MSGRRDRARRRSVVAVRPRQARRADRRRPDARPRDRCRGRRRATEVAGRRRARARARRSRPAPAASTTPAPSTARSPASLPASAATDADVVRRRRRRHAVDRAGGARAAGRCARRPAGATPRSSRSAVDHRPLPMAVRRSPAIAVAATLLAGGERRLRALRGRALALAVDPRADWRTDDPDGATLRDVDRRPTSSVIGLGAGRGDTARRPPDTRRPPPEGGGRSRIGGRRTRG